VRVLAVLLLLTNLALGTSLNGARNWIIIGGVSFQPSEFVKVAFVFVSACSLDRMIKTKNIMSFLAFTGVCLISLAIMRDFGTAAVYFATLLVILSLRLCDIKFIVALGGGAAVCFGALIKVIPYISARFATYRHAWEYANSSGYQQTRTMMSIASGGLFGLGAGNGTLSSVSAADTDLVFGMVAEEFGLIVALVVALIPIIYLIYAAVCIPRTRSIYYGVTAAAAAAMFIIQTALNIFGSVDLLPLTGVTVPFVSNGGSSMLASFMLLAFIKTAGSKIITLEKKEGA
jgi:cell division protein FtsW (lipid II flippase)